MSTYPHCPRCSNDENGASIWNCEDCGCVHCMDCDDSTNGACPECESRNLKQVGTIDNDAFDPCEDEGGDEEFNSCPRCENIENGDTIWKCKDCGCVHCANCDCGGSCPECGSNRLRQIGFIDN